MKSNLKIFKNGAEIPLPKGARYAIDMSLEPIAEAAEVVRAVDGSAVSLGMEGFRLYDVSISCSDHNIAPIAGIWPGDVLTIHASVELTDPGPAVMLSREPVPGSVRAHAADGAVIATPEGRTVNVPGASYFSYRPILNVMVTGKSARSTEWKASSAWSISATEMEPSQEVGGIVETWDQVDATGGEISEYTDELNRSFRVHVFRSSGNLDATADGDVDLLVVGGGGGSGSGGGGAGGFYRCKRRLAVGLHTIVVGAGGAGGTNGDVATTARHGRSGSASSALGITARGGGGGLGAASVASPWESGGSGGGRAKHNYYGYPDSYGRGDAYYGHDGGNTNADFVGGGGGGAGEPGGAGTSAANGAGGAGLMDDITGQPIFYAGGGAGNGNGVNGGGVGGGGSMAEPGAQNTGGGAGSGDCAGGSGIVIIRYRIA